MDLFANLLLGLQTSISPINLLYCLMGCFLGTLIGVLPGLGPPPPSPCCCPLTFTLPPVSALIMLAGIYYGSQYGGSTTSILVNLPGEAASVVTTLDGYQMARQGRAGVALATAAIGSFFAGTVATLLLALFAPPLAEVALKFGPADYFSLMVLGLVASVVLAQGSLLHAIGMVIARPAPWACRHGCQFRRAAVHLRYSRTGRRHRFRGGGHGHVRPGRDHPQPGAGGRPRALAIKQDHQSDADQGGLEAHGRADPAGDRSRFGPRHPAGQRLHPGILCRLFHRKENLEELRTNSARAPSKAWPPPNRPITPAPRPPLSRC